MENSLIQGKGIPFRQPNIFQKRMLQPFSELKQFEKNIPSSKGSLLNKQNVNSVVNNTIRRNVQNMNRVYAERKAKLDDKKFWEERNRKEYEKNRLNQANRNYFKHLS